MARVGLFGSIGASGSDSKLNSRGCGASMVIDLNTSLTQGGDVVADGTDARGIRFATSTGHPTITNAVLAVMWPGTLSTGRP